MYTVYILENAKGRFYIGYTAQDVIERLAEHNHGKSRWTKGKGPWKIRYIEIWSSREEAYRRERQIKSYKGGRAFHALIDSKNFGEVA